MSVIIDGSMTLHRLKRRLIKTTFRAARDVMRTAHGRPSSSPSSARTTSPSSARPTSPSSPAAGIESSTASRRQVSEVEAVSSAASKSPPASATKAELYEEAKRRDIPGRSSMTKAQLRDALAG